MKQIKLQNFLTAKLKDPKLVNDRVKSEVLQTILESRLSPKLSVQLSRNFGRTLQKLLNLTKKQADST